MVINKALLIHGYSNFKLEILEYCNPKDLVKREQRYIDILTPEYNVLNTAYSSLGYKHTKDSLVKLTNKTKNN
jgi:group I intron endonuclease